MNGRLGALGSFGGGAGAASTRVGLLQERMLKVLPPYGLETWNLPVRAPITADSLASDTKLVLEEITRCLNLEKLLQCYKFTVTVSCLKAIRKLQKFGHLPSNPSLFRSYAAYGQFIDVRLAALEALVDFTRVDGRWDDLVFLLDLIENDPDPRVRHSLVRLLVENPPFDRAHKHRLDREELVDRLWSLMNCQLSHDSHLRCDIVDLYYTLYGSKKPICIAVPELSSILNINNLKTERRRSPVREKEVKPLPPAPMFVPASDVDIPSISGVKRKASSPLRETEVLTDDNNLGLVTVEIVAGDEGNKVRVKESAAAATAATRVPSPLPTDVGFIPSNTPASAATSIVPSAPTNAPPVLSQSSSAIPKTESRRDKETKSEYFSDNSQSLPGIMGSSGPVGFEPGMFHKEEGDKQKSEPSSKLKKKKKDKKKHKHKHKHRHDHKHGKEKGKEKEGKDNKDSKEKDKKDLTHLKIREETLSSGSSSPSPSPINFP